MPISDNDNQKSRIMFIFKLWGRWSIKSVMAWFFLIRCK